MKWLFIADQHPGKQLLTSGVIIILCFVVFQLFSIISGLIIFRIPWAEIQFVLSDMSNPRNLAFMKWIQAVSSAGMFIIAAWLIALAINRDWKHFLKMDNMPGALSVLLAGLIMIIFMPFANLLTSFNEELNFPEGLSGLENFFHSREDQMQQIMESFLNVRGVSGLLVNFVVIAIIPAIGEELIFRGVVQDRFSAWFKNHHWAILLTSFIFAALHFQFLSFLPRFFLSMILGYIFVWSGSIWMTIIAHFINNAVAVMFYYLYFHGKADKSFEVFGTTQNGIWYSVISVVVGFAMFYWIKVLSNKSSVAGSSQQ